MKILSVALGVGAVLDGEFGIGLAHAGAANSHMHDLRPASRPGSLSTCTSVSSAWTMPPASSSSFMRARSLDSQSSQALIV